MFYAHCIIKVFHNHFITGIIEKNLKRKKTVAWNLSSSLNIPFINADWLRCQDFANAIDICIGQPILTNSHLWESLETVGFDGIRCSCWHNAYRIVFSVDMWRSFSAITLALNYGDKMCIISMCWIGMLLTCSHHIKWHLIPSIQRYL